MAHDRIQTGYGIAVLIVMLLFFVCLMVLLPGVTPRVPSCERGTEQNKQVPAYRQPSQEGSPAIAG